MDPAPTEDSDESIIKKDAVTTGFAHAMIFIVGLLLSGVVALLYCLFYPAIKQVEKVGVKTESVQR